VWIEEFFWFAVAFASLVAGVALIVFLSYQALKAFGMADNAAAPRSTRDANGG
jgi:hypothetical protein